MKIKIISAAWLAALVAAPCVQAAYYSNFGLSVGDPFAPVSSNAGPDGWLQSYPTDAGPAPIAFGYNVAGVGVGLSGINAYPGSDATFSISKSGISEPVVGSLLAVQFSLLADITYPERNKFSVGFAGDGGNIFTFFFTPGAANQWDMSYKIGAGMETPFFSGNALTSGVAGQIVVNFAGGPIVDGPTTMNFVLTDGIITLNSPTINVSGLSSSNVTGMAATMHRGTAVLDADAWGSNTMGVNNFVVVPEPSTALLSVAALGLLGLRRRRD